MNKEINEYSYLKKERDKEKKMKKTYKTPKVEIFKFGTEIKMEIQLSDAQFPNDPYIDSGMLFDPNEDIDPGFGISQ